MEDRGQEGLMLRCLRRAILDSLWSRESSTISSTYGRARALEGYGRALGLGKMGPVLGPFPLKDTMGMKIAMAMVLKSLEPGRNAATVQFDTIRQLRSAYSNMFNAGVKQNSITIFSKDTKKLHATQCPTDGPWFGRFCLGMEKRMGRQIKQDLGLSIEVMLELQRLLERDWRNSNDVEERRQVCIASVLFIVAFCWGLRGEELLLIALGATRQVWPHSQVHPTPHVMLALVGSRKRLTGDRAFLLPCVPITKSGLEPGKWLGRTLDIFERCGRVTGYLLIDEGGERPKLSRYSDIFVDYLSEVQSGATGLIPEELVVSKEYGLPRSARRGVTTHARNVNVAKVDIEANQMWRKTELNVGRSFRPNNMLQYYTEVAQSLPLLLKFSRPL